MPEELILTAHEAAVLRITAEHAVESGDTELYTEEPVDPMDPNGCN